MAQERKTRFALFSPQVGATFDTLLERAKLAEHSGFHSMWLVDHFWSPRLAELNHLECITAMSALAARTERLRLGTLVLCNGFRNPALLAKSLCSIDHISSGRLELGLGAGWMEPEFGAYGYEFPRIGVRLAQLAEALQIIKLMFTDSKPSFTGRYYRIEQPINNPKPVQKPYPPITIGGGGEKVLLKIVACHADRWNCPAGYKNFEAKLAALKAHCQTVGRDFSSIEISEQLLVCLGTNDDDVEQKWKMVKGMRPFSDTAIKGTPEQVVAALRERVARGIDTFIIFFSDMAQPATVELFAKEVMPAFA